MFTMQRTHRSWVYILASRKNGTLYVGVTTDLRRRVWQHKAKVVDGFSKQHGVVALVHCEEFSSLKHAISREKAVKGWKRNRKIALIEGANPDWDDLAVNWFEQPLDPSLRSG
jgi:putative endonuclease